MSLFLAFLFAQAVAAPAEAPRAPEATVARQAAAVHPLAAVDSATGVDWNARAAEHLLSRAGFGARPDEVAAAVRMGRAALVERLLDGEGRESEPFFVREFRRTPYDREAAMAMTDEERDALRSEYRRQDQRQMVEYAAWWIDEMRAGPHPLRERMTLFWHGFFTSSMRDVKSSVVMIGQHEFLRENALGSFRDLLAGIVRDPAMLVYLNNNQNRRAKPNENLARELMELFSLGEGNYTEDDVKEAARALTGWHVQRGEFRVVTRQHDRGPKTVLGETGRLDGDDLPGILLAQPACARWVAGNLIDYLEGAAPDAERLEDYATFLRERDYAIAPFLERLFADPAFYRAEIVGNRIAGPVDYLVGSSRRLGIRPPPAVLYAGASLLGQRLFEPPSVKGWDGGAAWITTSTLLARGNMTGVLLGVVTAEDLMRVDPVDLGLVASAEDEESMAGSMEEELAVSEVDPAEEAGEPGAADEPGVADETAESMEPAMEPAMDQAMDEAMEAEMARATRLRDADVRRRSPEYNALRLLDRVNWRPLVHLSRRCERAGARTDEQVVAYLCDELLAVPVSEASRRPLVEFLAAERAAVVADADDLGDASEPAKRRLRRFYAPATREELAYRRLAHVILSLPEAQLH